MVVFFVLGGMNPAAVRGVGGSVQVAAAGRKCQSNGKNDEILTF